MGSADDPGPQGVSWQDHDRHDPAKGCGLVLLLALGMWIAIVGIVWWLWRM